MTRVLGIETSCDETGVAVVEDGIRIVAEELASQVKHHAEFGGVVPEIASRRHTTCITQLTEKVLEAAGRPVDAVAATAGPGLMGSLMVGMNFGKALAYGWGVPFVPVNHLEGHIYSPFIGKHEIAHPLVALLVSGGHTCLIHAAQHHEYRLLGTTRDDAVGEAFDKVARLLDLPYPGGPSIQAAAANGDPNAIDFPRGMAAKASLDFSYSGLKTAVLYYLQRNGKPTADVAASFQAAAIDVLITKTKECLVETGVNRLVVAGGVAANALLRQRLESEIDAELYIPPLKLCMDNGAMIAAAGHWRLKHGLVGTIRDTPNPNLSLF